MEFNKGDRVKLSKEGLKALATYREAQHPLHGTVSAQPRTWKDCTKVRWDNRKSSSSYHNSFLTKVK